MRISSIISASTFVTFCRASFRCPYTVSTYDDAAGCDVLYYWLIHGMEHAHPDAPGDGPYTDLLGPDVTAASYAFFAAHPRNGRCPR